MDCPECGTWNPDDKIRCWRCNTLLPTPEEKKKTRNISKQTWFWVGAILIFVLMTICQCSILGGGGDQEGVGQIWEYAPLLARFVF